MEKEKNSETLAKQNAIAFFVSSGLFFLYWLSFALFGLYERPENIGLYFFFIAIELLCQSAILLVSILSLRKKNREKYELFFTINWVLLALATFPLPFAFLFSSSVGNAPFHNEIASFATPTTILTLLSLFFASSAYEKYKEEDYKWHKTFAELMVGTLFAAAIYTFGCMIYKISVGTNPKGVLTNVYFYLVLALIYIALCVYASIRINKESKLPYKEIARKAPDSDKSLFGIANGFYFAYGLINLTIDCYSLASAFKNDNVTLSVRYGYIDSTLLLGDSIFLFMTHLGMTLYAFLLIHDKDKSNKRDPLYSLNVLCALFALSYLVTSFVGSYGLIKKYVNTDYDATSYIISNLMIFCFGVIAFACALAGLFKSKKYRVDSALFLAIASFMMVGIVFGLIYGEISVLLKNINSLSVSIPSILQALPDIALVSVNIVAFSKEYPSKEN